MRAKRLFINGSSLSLLFDDLVTGGIEAVHGWPAGAKIVGIQDNPYMLNQIMCLVEHESFDEVLDGQFPEMNVTFKERGGRAVDGT